MCMHRAFSFGFKRHGVSFSSLWLKYGNANIDPVVLAELTSKAQSIYESLFPSFFRCSRESHRTLSTDFFNLVLMQWFNLLSARTRRLSIFQQNPLEAKTRGTSTSSRRCSWHLDLRGKSLDCGNLASAYSNPSRTSFFSYIPWFEEIFLTRGVAVKIFFLPLACVYSP